jgi:hypothetical protein
VKREDKGGEIWSKYFIPYMKTEIWNQLKLL